MSPPPVSRADLVTLGGTYCAIGITVSAIMTDIGTSPAVAMAAAVLAYSATGELAFASVIVGGGGLPAALASGWLVSSRFALLAMSLSPRLRAPWWERAAAAASAVDPSVALAIAQDTPTAVRRTYWRVTLWLFVGFAAGSAIGLGVGNVIGDTRRIGLDAVFPASLVAILAGAVRRRDAAAAGALGAAAALALAPFTPGGTPILVAAAAAPVALAVDPRPFGSRRR
ncbi:MAG: AzlC family ABC transporter permease [Acidimicrobiales bacterium]